MLGAVFALLNAAHLAKHPVRPSGRLGNSCGPMLPGCYNGEVCVPLNKNCAKNCVGSCGIEYKPCDGNATSESSNGCNNTELACMIDPRFPAFSDKYICVSESLAPCGGIAGRPCRPPLKCYDNPKDGCNPNKGGRDCIGVCL